MPVRLRLAVLFAVGTAVVGLLFGYLFVSELSGGLRGSVVNALQARANTVLGQLPETGVPASGFQFQGGSQGNGGPDETSDLTQLLGRGGRIIAAAGPASGRRIVTIGELRSAHTAPVVVGAHVGARRTHFLLLVTAVSAQARTFVVVGQPLTTVDRAISQVTIEIAVAGAVAVVGAALAAWLLASLALIPVERMRRQAEDETEEGIFTTLHVPKSNDEIARLAQTLNTLLERLQGALERERGFSAAAGHELRSPLAIVRAELELAGRPGRSAEYLCGAVQRATAEVDRVVELADRLLLLSRGDEGALRLHRVDADLREVVRQAVDALGPWLAREGIVVAVQGSSVLVAVDPAAFRRIVENLVENAARHGGSTRHVDVIIRPADFCVTLEVVDDGLGFPPEFLPRAFERFSRPDASRNRASGGSGLGLSIVRTLVHAHGGTVAARNGARGGAVVTVVVPRAAAPPPPADRLAGVEALEALPPT